MRFTMRAIYLLEIAGLAAATHPAPVVAKAIVMAAKAAAPDASKTLTVTVGGLPGGPQAAGATGKPVPSFQFFPESVTAQPGQTIRFEFLANNHSVVQTSFDSPCTPAQGGFNSGFIANEANTIPGPTKDFTVKDAGPLYMSCLQVTHCGKGMVFTINPPAEGKGQSHNLFKQAAIKVGGNNLALAAIQAPSAVAQVASTISINVGNQNAAATGATGAAGAVPSVVAGQGSTGNGQACSCMCLCGAGAFPGNAGQGAFGGFLGMSFR
ncbi:hypothetical protein EJ06DRAFT_531359 [Trichodelitschia bisporula]|uniref:Cupredoxin n=1 Tax=Trichodelitschia bisporula TaxID=703511 RepID=A0A6G1HSZ8_9PEZI|nr:hypothetical protein EJ06DRAFT_531359 [Trichodelitschia bisporula]